MVRVCYSGFAVDKIPLRGNICGGVWYFGLKTTKQSQFETRCEYDLIKLQQERENQLLSQTNSCK